LGKFYVTIPLCYIKSFIKTKVNSTEILLLQLWKLTEKLWIFWS